MVSKNPRSKLDLKAVLNTFPPPAKKVMVLIQMKTSDLSTLQIEQEKQRLVEYWSSFAPKIKTLMVQQWNGDSNGVREGGTEVVMGDGYVYEHLLGHRFRISSHAFFQVNTPATEHMLQTCAEWCHQEEERKTTLLDLCCGCGSIGITMANTVDRVVGIEMIPDAINDAKFNASLNRKLCKVGERKKRKTRLLFCADRYYKCTVPCRQGGGKNRRHES
jgi:tRNA/tmRNA/rRNA uracil-C5-methylase (TrmA/RlmC/RlmD family)